MGASNRQSYCTKVPGLTKTTKIKMRMFEMKMQLREYVQDTFVQPFRKRSNSPPNKKRPNNRIKDDIKRHRKLHSDGDYAVSTSRNQRGNHWRDNYCVSDSQTTTFTETGNAKRKKRSGLTQNKSDLVEEILRSHKSEKIQGDGDILSDCGESTLAAVSSCSMVMIKEPKEKVTNTKPKEKVTKTKPKEQVKKTTPKANDKKTRQKDALKKKKYKSKACQASLESHIYRKDLEPEGSNGFPKYIIPSAGYEAKKQIDFKTVFLRVGEFFFPEVPRHRKKELPPKLLKFGVGFKAKVRKQSFKTPESTQTNGQELQPTAHYNSNSIRVDSYQGLRFTSTHLQVKAIDTPLRIKTPPRLETKSETTEPPNDTSFLSFFRNLKKTFVIDREEDRLTQTELTTNSPQFLNNSFYDRNETNLSDESPVSNNPLGKYSLRHEVPEVLSIIDRDPILFVKSTGKSAFTAKFQHLLEYKIGTY